MLLSSDSLEAFAVFAEQRNFTRAAAILHLSQPSLHVKITKLASAVGVPLYRRDGRSLHLTEAGIQLADHVRVLQENQAALLANFGQASIERPLTIVAGEGALSTIVEPGLRLLPKRDRHRLRLVTADAAGSIDLVQRGQADVGVAVIDEMPGSLEFCRVRRIGQKLVVPSDHVLASRKRISLRDLDGERFVLPPVGRPHRLMVARALRNAEVRWELAVEVSGWETMTQMVSLGFGVAIVNENVRVPKGTKALALPMLPAIEYHAFWLDGSSAQPRIEALVDAITAGGAA
jgi:DNA-binding transcriptional LysR family regulator